MDHLVTTPGVIFTVTRSGGGYLSHCLDAHSQMLWDTANKWAGLIYGSTTVTENLLRVLLTRPRPVSGTKLVTGQALPISMAFWQEMDGLRVICMERENVLRSAISAEVKRAKRRGHRWPFHLDPAEYLENIRSREILAGKLKERCDVMEAAGMAVYHTTYARIAGEGPTSPGIPEAEALRICDFLGVGYEPLATDLKRNHPLPLTALLTNYAEIKAAVTDADYGRWLEDEAIWHRG